jgi:hypothetical protein
LLFLLLVLCVIPAFLGESHFAFVGYSLAHLLTPVRRELDYLRALGTSKESTKEVKVFGLGDHLRNRFDQLTGTIIEENKNLSRRRLLWGSLLGMLGSIGYYAAYALLVFRAIKGQMSVGDLTFLGGSLLGCANQISMLFSLREHRGSGLVPHRSAGVLRSQSAYQFASQCPSCASPHAKWLRISQCVFQLPRIVAADFEQHQPPDRGWGADCAGR